MVFPQIIVVILKFSHKHRESIIVVASTFAFFVALLSPQIAPPAKCAYTATAKPMEFYLHYSDIPVTVAGLQTKYIMDTTRDFSFSTQQEVYANSLYKPNGLPKIVVDFYVYPNLAGPVTVDGSWQLFVWLNGSAYKPTSFSLSFREITVGGAVLWDSGLLNPTVTSSIGSYIDVPVYNYNLSVRLDHTFSVGTTLLVECEVNAGSSADTRFWYDSELYPSKVILPAKDYARPMSIKTYSIDDSETSLFHHNWTESWRKVVVRANITDPFGGYDLHTVNITILDPAGIPVLKEEMTRVSDGQWRVSYQHLFEASWSYSTTAELGNYTVIVTVTDNNGYYRNLDSGSFEPFVEEETHTFTIGIIVYHDPTFLITDDVDEPLPDAKVYVTWRNGTTDALPRYTSPDGSINLTQVSSGNYGFTIYWKDVTVAQTTVYVDSVGPYTIKTRVYQLTVQVLGNNGAPIHGAYVVANTLAGVGFGLDITNETGEALFKLPSGIYNILIHYTSAYWLSVVETTTSEQLSITTSTSETIVLDDFPPAIWSTALFWFLVILILAATVTIVLILYQRKRA